MNEQIRASVIAVNTALVGGLVSVVVQADVPEEIKAALAVPVLITSISAGEICYKSARDQIEAEETDPEDFSRR